MTKETIAGVNISILSKETCLEIIQSWVYSSDKARYFVCANPHSLETARNDQVFSQALKNADLVTPDGIGIIIASKILGGIIHERITGSDIFSDLSNSLNKGEGFNYFFLGSTEEVLSRIKDRMKRDFPNINIVGTYSPPFKLEFSEKDNAKIVDSINRARPDILWVGMTAPKQEKWIYQNRDKLNVKFIGAIGAVFDFYAGTVKRPNPWFQTHGLEWLPRLISEPRRLWRRNLISTPKFMIRVIKEYIVRKVS